MKKLISLILAVSLALLAGCAQNAPVSESTSASEALADKHASQAVTVSTVDEFLAALGSDKEITLAPGTYDLHCHLSPLCERGILQRLRKSPSGRLYRRPYQGARFL